MRGKDDEGRLKLRHVGITPAYAGKSALQLCTDSCSRDHPRVCGEKFRAYAKIWNEWGSPPRMRGKALAFRSYSLAVRITPAYAGKSNRGAAVRPYIQDHPRVCGEKPLRRHTMLNPNGITPAYAGKRLKRSRSTVSPVAIVPLFPSVCNKPVVSDGSPAVRDAPFFLPAENAVPASPACNLRSL